MADTLDLLTLAEAKAALNIPTGDTQFDTEVALYVTAVSQRLDDWCGPIVKRTVTGEEHDGGVMSIWPRRRPLAAVSTVTEYVGGTGTALTAESLTTAGGYLLKDAGTFSSRLRRRSGFSDIRWSGRVVVLTYTAGRFENTAGVSAKFKEAAAKTLVWFWKGDQGAGSATFGAADNSLPGLGAGLPDTVVDLLAAETIPISVA